MAWGPGSTLLWIIEATFKFTVYPASDAAQYWLAKARWCADKARSRPGRLRPL
jgi:hypothetical protein